MSNAKRRAEAHWMEKRKLWQITVKHNGARRDFYSSTKGRTGKHEAEAKADAWLESETSEKRFRDAWEAFLADTKARTGTGNYKKMESAGRLYILPEMQNRKLSQITAPMWQKCVNAVADKNLSRRYCKNVRDYGMAFLEFCRKSRWEYVPVSARDISIPNAAKPAKARRVLQPDEVNLLFKVDSYKRHNRTEFAHYIHAWRFLVATGLRRGELIGLQWQDITDSTVSIQRSFNEQNEQTFGKNDNARRTFTLTPTARDILDDQRRYMKRIGIISPWVFPDEDGQRVEARVFYGRWHTFSTQHGFQMSLHELRHTFVSLNKAMPVELIKMVVGHSTDMDTYGIYGHDVEGESEQAAQIIESNFRKIIKK